MRLTYLSGLAAVLTNTAAAANCRLSPPSSVSSNPVSSPSSSPSTPSCVIGNLYPNGDEYDPSSNHYLAFGANNPSFNTNCGVDAENNAYDHCLTIVNNAADGSYFTIDLNAPATAGNTYTFSVAVRLNNAGSLQDITCNAGYANQKTLDIDLYSIGYLNEYQIFSVGGIPANSDTVYISCSMTAYHLVDVTLAGFSVTQECGN